MPKIFKVGNYGKKGNYSTENLKSWIGKEFNITAGHVGDWTKNGYPITAIPIAGTCKVTEVDNNGYLIGEFNYNSFGEKIKNQYPNLSIGIGENGEPNHLAILGYAPPHLKDLDKSFSEFSQDLTSIEKTETIEFEDKELPKELSTEEMIPKLREQGYTVEKTSEFSEETLKTIADNLGFIVANKPIKNLTQEEIYERVKAEFAREAEKEETKKKIISMFPPVMHKILEFAVDKAYEETEYTNIIEFSENEKETMANKLKEFSKDESPFKELFKNYLNNKDFNKEIEETPLEKAKRIANLY